MLPFIKLQKYHIFWNISILCMCHFSMGWIMASTYERGYQKQHKCQTIRYENI